MAKSENSANEKKEAHPLELIHPRPLKHMSNKLHHHVKGKLWLRVLFGLVIGIIVGLLIGPEAGIVNPDTAKLIGEWLALPGNIFLRIIQMIVIPLVFASIIRGIAASENIEQLKRTGIFISAYFIITTTIAILIGIVLVGVIEPGQYMSPDYVQSHLGGMPENISTSNIGTPNWEELPTAISTVLPTNLVGSMINGELLQIVVFAIMFGIALVYLRPEQSKPMLEVLGSLQRVCMIIVKWAMLLAPLAVFGLMAKVTSQLGVEALTGLLVYVLTVLLGLLILLLFYLLIVKIFTGMNSISFLRKIKDVQLLAFSTSSSAAVMPLSLKIAEEKLKVRPSISQFIIPIGATVNMDGTALYQAIAAIFLAQIFGIHLTFGAMVLLILTIVGASIGSPGTPGIGIIILAVAINSIGIPLAGIALILGVDRILDMCRTAINVTGDLTASVVMNRIIGSSKTQEEEMAHQTKLEVHRKKHKTDVVIRSVAWA